MLILGQDDILSWCAADELFLLHEVSELFHSYTEFSKDMAKVFFILFALSSQWAVMWVWGVLFKLSFQNIKK